MMLRLRYRMPYLYGTDVEFVEVCGGWHRDSPRVREAIEAIAAHRNERHPDSPTTIEESEDVEST